MTAETIKQTATTFADSCAEAGYEQSARIITAGTQLVRAGRERLEELERRPHDGEQMTSTIILMVVVIAVGAALWTFAKNVLYPVIQEAASNLKNYTSDSSTWIIQPAG
jgi:hypothetical protein